jgi:hypothetical protein
MLVVFKDSKRGAELRETRSLVQVRLQVAGWLVPRSEWKKWRNPVTSRDSATFSLGIVAHLDRVSRLFEVLLSHQPAPFIPYFTQYYPALFVHTKDFPAAGSCSIH